MTTTTNTGTPLVQATRARRKKRGEGFIKDAVKSPGSLHRALGVPRGQKIPNSALSKAAKSQSATLKRKANLAKTLKGLGK